METRSELSGQRTLEPLVVDYFCGMHSMLKMDELGARMPPVHVELDSKNSASVRQIVEQIGADPRCGIRLQAETARFDPVIEGTEQIAAFNLYLPLAKAFDPTLNSASELSELVAKTRRLDMSMA